MIFDHLGGMPLSAFLTISRPFEARDIHRVGEFFDGDLEAAYHFIQTVWLPDMSKTASALDRAVRSFDVDAVAAACEHLRESARNVGARKIVEAATAIELAARERDWRTSGTQTHRLSLGFVGIASWLKRRARRFERAIAAYRQA